MAGRNYSDHNFYKARVRVCSGPQCCFMAVGDKQISNEFRARGRRMLSRLCRTCREKRAMRDRARIHAVRIQRILRDRNREVEKRRNNLYQMGES